jgi:MSHA pilin protein MshB
MKKQQGFTLIELVIVVIILGLLGAAAVPRFLDATDDARDASVEGVAGGFASAVGLVRAEWELAGRPAGTANIDYDGVSLDVTDTGFLASLAGDQANAAALDSTACKEVFDNIMQSSPTSVLAGGTFNGERYAVRYDAGNDLCQYVLVQDLNVGDTVAAGYVNNGFTTASRQGFTYNADTGQVVVRKNP